MMRDWNPSILTNAGGLSFKEGFGLQNRWMAVMGRQASHTQAAVSLCAVKLVHCFLVVELYAYMFWL